MPEENIVDMAAKCRVLLLDIEGTTTSISFVKEKLFPYAEEHVQGFLETEWEHEEVRAAVQALRKLAINDAEEKVEGAVALPAEDASKEEQIEGLVKNVKWQMSVDRKVGPLKLLQGLIWKQGYDKGDIQGHVYEDVAAALEAWRTDSRKIYVYSSGSEQAQKLLFAHSASGDLLPQLDGHFDTAVGAKQEADSYKSIVDKINYKPEEILFLTDIIEEAEAARTAGLKAALVVRPGNAALPEDHTFPVISSLAELCTAAAAADEESSAGTKRKQDLQEEQPAKVAKAALEDDVKSAIVEITEEESKPAETMEVDAAPASENVKDEEKVVIEEITEVSSVATDATVVAEPAAIEEPVKEMQTDDKTEAESKTEQPTKESKIETVEAVQETEKATPEAPEEAMEAEESPPDVTEIEDVTDKKSEEGVETLSIEPVVEEPLDDVADADMEVLQSVGELQKECDDLLSKVKDVTDLVQPPLPAISEEDAEGEKNESEKTEIDAIEMDSIEQTPSKTETAVEKAEIELEATEDTTKSKEEIIKTKEEITETKEEITETKETAETKEEITETEEEITETKEKTTTESPKEPIEQPTKTDEKTPEVAESPKETIEKPTKPEEKTPGVSESTEPEKIEPEKTHVNGDSETKETNGVKLNGDSNGEERLAENGDGAERVNGSNGEAKETAAEEENGKAKTEVSEIKVKSVADASSEPVQQTTDA